MTILRVSFAKDRLQKHVFTFSVQIEPLHTIRLYVYTIWSRIFFLHTCPPKRVCPRTAKRHALDRLRDWQLVICKYSDNILFLLIAYFLPNCSLQIKLILFDLQLSPEKSKGAEVTAKEKPPHVIYINCKMYAMMTYGYNKRDLYVSQLIIHFLQYFTFNCVISGRR